MVEDVSVMGVGGWETGQDFPFSGISTEPKANRGSTVRLGETQWAG